jgi:hypothetical protein
MEALGLNVAIVSRTGRSQPGFGALTSRSRSPPRYLDMTKFMIRSLPAGDVDVDPSRARRMFADGPSPGRRCLRNAEIGDALVLAPYNPFTLSSPYAGEGPVFVHADGCTAHQPVPGALCEQVFGRLLSVRAYDAEAMMLGSEVLPGEQLAERAAAWLGSSSAFLHVHFAGPGCFAFRVDPVRAQTDGAAA